MFHIELRQFPHVARAFNLSLEELAQRVLSPWVAGRMVQWGDRQWAPERARLTIYEGPELRQQEIGLGRGWSNVVRGGTDVTASLLEQARRQGGRDPSLDQLKGELEALCVANRVALHESIRLATALNPARRASERLALAEQAVWELLHEGRVRLVHADGDGARVVQREQWQPVLLAWSTWSSGPTAAFYVESATAGFD